MTEQKATQSKEAAKALAKQQHMPVRKFLNQEPARTELLTDLIGKKGEGKELKLLEKLLESKEPVSFPHSKDGEEEIDYGMPRSTASEAAKSLNDYLINFSKSKEAKATASLKDKRIEIRVRHKEGKGGFFIGYYFYCYKYKTNAEREYGSDTKELFEDIWKKFFNVKLRKKLKEEAQRQLLEKLKGRDDYKPLDMEIGTVPEKSQQDGTATEAEQPNSYDHNRVWEYFDAKVLFGSKGLYILSSDCGMGKTTFLRHRQLEILELPDFIPIFLNAKEIEGWGCEPEPDRISRFRKDLAKKLVENSSLKVHEDRIASFLSESFEKDIILLVDGLDQITGGAGEYEPLAKYILGLSKNVIIASRPSAVVALEDQEDVNFLRLKPFSRNTQERYFGKQHYKRARELTINCPDLIAVPMLAYMVRTLIEDGEDKDVKNRTDLYRRFIEHILTGHKHGEMQLPLGIRNEIRANLQKISYYAINDKEKYVQRIPLKFYNSKPLQQELTMKADELTRSGLVNLIIESGDCLYFTHQSFQEYLAAEGAVEDSEEIENILGQMWNPKWKETIKFLAGMTGEDFIKRIYSPGCKDNCIHSRLFLAAECCGELGRVCELEKPIFDQLRELVFEPIFVEEAFTSIGQLNSPEAIDFFVSIVLGTNKDLPEPTGILLETIFHAQAIRPPAQTKNYPEYIGRFLSMLETNGALHGDRIIIMGKLTNSLTDELINRMIELECSNKVSFHFSEQDWDDFAGGLSSSHIDQIFEFIANEDEDTKLTSLRFIRNILEHDIKRLLQMKHIETLIRYAETDSYKEEICGLITLLATRQDSSDRLADWMIETLKTGAKTLQDIIIGNKRGFPVFCDKLSLPHLNHILKFLDEPNPKIQMIGLKVLYHRRHKLSTKHVAEITSLLDSKEDRLRQFTLKLLEGINCSLEPDQIDKIIDLLLDENKILVAAAMRTLSYFIKDMKPTQEERILGIFCKMEHDFTYTPLLCAKIPDPAFFEDSFCPISKRLIEERLDVINNLLNSQYSIQQKIGIELLIKLGDGMEEEHASRIVNLLSRSTQDVIEKALFSLQIVPQKLSDKDITKIIDYLSNQHFGVRQAARTCLIPVEHKLSEPHITKIEDLLQHQYFGVAVNALELLARIPEKVSSEAIGAIVHIPENEEFCTSYSAKQARDVCSDIAKFEIKFESEHIDLFVNYTRSSKKYLKIIGLEVLKEINQVVPIEVFSEIIEYVQSDDVALCHSAGCYLGMAAHTSKKEYVQEIVKRYRADPANTGIYRIICAVPAKQLNEYLGSFITFIDHRDANIQHYTLNILTCLIHILEPYHIKQVENLFHDSHLSSAYDFLKKTYQIRGLPQ